MTDSPSGHTPGKPTRIDFQVRPATWHPLNLVAYAATLACLALVRCCGVSRFNAVRRLTGRALSSQRLKATGYASVFVFPALDGYWIDMFWGGPPAEPELFAFMLRLKDEPFAFIDGGANLGYWSTLVSGEWFGGHPTVAVEASTETLAWLEANRLANGSRFRAMHAALFGTPGLLLPFDEHPPHAARCIAAPGSDASTVVSTTVDEIVERHLPEAGALVVKLDLEGAEPDGIAGSARSRRERDCLFIVEDHGSDDQHRSTAACLQAGLIVEFLLPDGSTALMPDLAAVARVKTCRAQGYNFVAYAPSSPLARRIGLTADRRPRP
jgi:FkbM family methyltransferase